ncbi:FluC/FEX family fluoride channel [Prochlorococcus marinus]|uniref:FluC/FEX family fluoride channel n=1 Tax=Prochlorococcus marinus TaxID=1219 RepID=UPI0005A14B52|nr:CrcB family protein [Prochlorococcus marinus]
MDKFAFIHILAGSTFGLILRLFIKYNFKINQGTYYNNTLIVNVLSSLFLGICVALSPTNNNFLLLFSVGFLGCLSTFSSFIYQLFNLIQKRKYLNLIFYYIEVFVLSFLFFSLGYFIILILKN